MHTRSATEIRNEIRERLGFVPAFFASAEKNPAMLENLWQQTLWARLNSSIPARLADLIATYLSRFCRRADALIESASSLLVHGFDGERVLSLLRTPRATASELEGSLETMQAANAWPAPDSDQERWLIQYATAFYFRSSCPALAKACVTGLGEAKYEELCALVSYVDTCHRWIQGHLPLAFTAEEGVLPRWEKLLESEGLRAWFEKYVPLVEEEQSTASEKFAKQTKADLEDRVAERTRKLSQTIAALHREMATRAQLLETNRRVESRLRCLWDSDIIGMTYADHRGRVLDANDAYLKMIGYTRADLERGDIRWSELSPPEFRGDRDRVLAELAARGAATPWEKEYIRKDGSRVSVLVGVTRADAETTTGFIIDLSHQKRTERALYESERSLHEVREAALTAQEAITKKLEIANRDLETLLHIVSHDLKEPLRAIENFSQMLHDGYASEVNPRGRDFLQRIVRAATRMRDLLNDVLTLAKVRAASAPKVSIPGQTIVNDALRRLETQIAESNASIRVHDDLPDLPVDRAWATQAIYNLVSNAVKFNGDSAPNIEIARFRSSAGDVAEQVGIVVRDRGPGVAPEHAERIFEMFQRAVGRDVEGTGAGLAIVREVAIRHGGKTWVQSREGGGSEFVITFGNGHSVVAGMTVLDTLNRV